MYYIYVPGGVTGVLKFYISIISDALNTAGHDSTIVCDLKDIPYRGNVVAIDNKYATKVKLRRKPRKLIVWFQGIRPEEMEVIFSGKWDKAPRVLIHRIWERYILSHSDLNILVSDAMREHYKDIYGTCGKRTFTMPCFGNSLERSAFFSERYSNPRFLYSGSIAAWQCIDQMLLLFKEIKKQIPTATLNILTPDRDEAANLIRKYNVNAEIDFIAPDRLQEYIKSFKYGFIVRDDIKMNQVATPTKMSNYMGAGIIPVYSDVVLDYKKHISGKSTYLVPFNTDKDCIEKILNIERDGVNTEVMLNDYSRIFDSYWNQETYTRELSEAIKCL